MGIVDEDIARVRAASDIVAVVTQHTQLRKVGQRWSGLCPFHNEKSPSFSVNAQEGLYYCFGCQASGDIITFVREIEHLDFVGANQQAIVFDVGLDAELVGVFLRCLARPVPEPWAGTFFLLRRGAHHEPSRYPAFHRLDGGGDAGRPGDLLCVRCGG